MLEGSSIKVKGEAALLAVNIITPNIIGGITRTEIGVKPIAGDNLIFSVSSSGG